jgi:hypothetical protein
LNTFSNHFQANRLIQYALAIGGALTILLFGVWMPCLKDAGSWTFSEERLADVTSSHIKLHTPPLNGRPFKLVMAFSGSAPTNVSSRFDGRTRISSGDKVVYESSFSSETAQQYQSLIGQSDDLRSPGSMIAAAFVVAPEASQALEDLLVAGRSYDIEISLTGEIPAKGSLWYCAKRRPGYKK